ncbi:MAG: FAD-dependent oxidoreductase [Deltaproteobacteria bacterium]|nr:FAD-dependent oxidoreductase [Deltaproteobacteria bacterium]
MGLKVEVPDLPYWREQIKCQNACPVHTDARGYIRAIADSNFEQAYLIARGPNPLASICGRICGAPCETACRRGNVDQSISIRALKRSAQEEGYPNLGRLVDLVKTVGSSIGDRVCAGLDDVGHLLGSLEEKKIQKVKGLSVGIVGSGPAGLSAAHDLALMGFSVVIYEMEAVAAGMLYLGVPAYRLPREIINAEVAVIRALGVDIQTHCTIGKDVSLEQLRNRHQAVIIAVGLKKSRTVPIAGNTAEGVFGGVEFLRSMALKEPHRIGKQIVVIGGGNVAYDVARSALRRQQMDIVGTLRREAASAEVTLCCLETRDQMLADEIEILEGEEEGVKRVNGYGPQQILTDEQNKVKGVLFHKVVSIFDEKKRFNPKFDPADSLVLKADTVLMAIGQMADLSLLQLEKNGIQLTERGTITSNVASGETSAHNVFVAGDLAHGPKLMIDAIASGKTVARSIYQKLTGQQLPFEALELHIPIQGYGREMGYEKLRRQALEVAPVEQRISKHDVLVERGFTRSQALLEASRCLDCGVNTIFDGNRCILCGGCVDVCPQICLKLVPASELDGNKGFVELTDLIKDKKQSDELTAIIKDEQKCIRCALCAIRCPVDAISMERFTFRECIG